MYKKTLTLVAILALGSIFVSPAYAENGLSKAEVEKIIGDYMRANPQVLVESLENYRTQQEQEQQASAQETIGKYKDYLEDSKAPSIGSAKADVTIVEFFDYNCGYCRRAVPDIQALVKEDGNVRVVFKEMPILSSNSNDIAKWSLAAHEQGKYFDFHIALMKHRGSRNADTIKDIAKDIGLNAKRLEKDSKSIEVKAELEKSLAVARDVGIQGTPAFIINGELYPGYLGPEGLKRAVESARQKL